jgi:cation diffusion facilitator family transporter
MPCQVRSHAGHSHHHHHDNTYLVSGNKNDAGVRITRIGLCVNVGMAITKGVGGYLLNSQALVADGFHALSDLVSDLMTLATISVALRPPTDRFPNGFGKVESFGSLLVSGLLLAGGLMMCKQSGMSLYMQFFADTAQHAAEHAGHAHEHAHGHGLLGHSHSAHDMIPNINAAWLAAGSIVIKEWLYRATMKIAKQRKSSVLASNAVHHRVDSLTSIVALVAIGGSHLLSGATWLDPVGGLIVSLMVIQAGWNNTRAAVVELCDATIDADIKASIRKAATRVIKDAGKEYEVPKVQGIKAGQNYLVDLEIAAPEQLTLAEMHELETAVRTGVGFKVRGVRRVRVKFVPANNPEDFMDEFIPAHVSPRSSPEPENEHEGEHGHDHGQGKRLKGSATDEQKGASPNGDAAATRRR